MFIRDTKNIYRFQVEKAVGKDATADQVLDYLFGNSYECSNNSFVIKEWSTDFRTKKHRLNMLWAIPLTIFCVPYQYIMKGKIGWDTKTTFGRWILKVTGYLKEY